MDLEARMASRLVSCRGELGCRVILPRMLKKNKEEAEELQCGYNFAVPGQARED